MCTFQKSLSPKARATRTERGQVMAEVTRPVATITTPLRQYCMASLVVEYSTRLSCSILITLEVVASTSAWYLSLNREGLFFRSKFSLNAYISQIILMLGRERRQDHEEGNLKDYFPEQREERKSKLGQGEDKPTDNGASLNKYLPELLEDLRNKEKLDKQLQKLDQFISRQFSQDKDIVKQDSAVDKAIVLLTKLKKQVNEKVSPVASPRRRQKETLAGRSKILKEEEGWMLQETSSPIRSKNASRIQLPTLRSKAMDESSSPVRRTDSMSPYLTKSKLLQSSVPSVPTYVNSFSHNAKHHYLSISADMQTVKKVSHSGSRFAAVGARCLTEEEPEVELSIDRSVSGNIMVGVCHQSVVRERQFINCYGIGNGAYLIGQNNREQTSISFHHSMPFLNRKEVVGWNFAEGETVVVGVSFEGEYVYFRKTGTGQEFTMKVAGEEFKPEIAELMQEGFKALVLLQSEGDQVTALRDD